jgi:hypothetical protein
MPNLKLRLIDEQTLQNNVQNVLANIDDLSALALSLPTSGPQGFQQFIELRDTFRSNVTRIMTDYNTVDIKI